MLGVVCCLLLVSHCLLILDCWLFVVCCLLVVALVFVACCLLIVDRGSLLLVR